MKFARLVMPAVVVTAMVSLAGIASAEIIFSDSFDRVRGSGDANGFPGPVNSSDWGDNDNALGGSAVQTYTFDESRGGGAQQTTDGSVAQLIGGAAQVELDLGPLAPLGYTVAFDFQRVTDGNGFIAMGIGLDDTDQIENAGGFNGNAFLFTNSANGAEAAVLVKQNGDVELWDGAAAPAQTIGGFYGDPSGVHSALVTVSAPSGYGAGSAGVLSLSIDGSAAASQDITFDGVSSGYLSFYSNLAGGGGVIRYGAIDNLVVTAIPEPSSLAIAAMACLGIFALGLRA